MVLPGAAGGAGVVLALAGCAALALLVHFTGGPEPGGGLETALIALGVPHAAAYLFLLALFGRTLLPAREPFVTAIARRIHGTLDPEIVVYTRRVTLAWCLFFAMQLCLSAALFLAAPIEIWSLFVNVFNVPLLALMFAAEVGYRVMRYPGHPRASLASTVRAFGASDRAAGAIPLLRGYDAGAVFAWRGGREICFDEFLSDVARAAAALPERPHVLNLCADRYWFAVGLGAALARGQVSLLPPSQAPDLIARLASGYPGLYCLRDDGGAVAGLQSLALTQLKAQPRATDAPMPNISAAQTAVIVFTSGSTGDPIPHRKSWGSLVASARAEAERLALARGVTVVGTVPAQHAYGLESTVLLPMQSGCVLEARRPFYAADIRAALEAVPRPRALVTTPVHLRVLLAESDPVPPVEFVLCATAPLAPQLARDAERRFAAPLYEIYGCTEAGQIAARRTTASEEWRTLGKVELRADGAGSWVRGGHVETEVLLSDVLELRGRSRFLLHGRTADLVNIAGKRASLAHLNFHLNSIAGVTDGAYALPDGAEGDATRLTAFVVAPGLTREAVLAALRERIDPAFLPRPLHFVDELPRNATGKLPRRALDELARKTG